MIAALTFLLSAQGFYLLDELGTLSSGSLGFAFKTSKRAPQALSIDFAHDTPSSMEIPTSSLPVRK